jgi:hypothetical protein
MSEIERFRARHRRMARGQQQPASVRVESLDVDDGRTRKISATWRQRQQLAQRNHFDDGIWPQSAGTEMHLGFNAFDFSSSPEAFCDDTEEPAETKVLSYEIIENGGDVFSEEQPEAECESEALLLEVNEQQQQKHLAEVGKQVTAMGFNSASLWEQSFPGLRYPGGPIGQLPTLVETPLSQGLWQPPVHYATYDDQRRALYRQPRC